MSRSRRARRGYALLVVLGFVAGFLALMIGWLWQSQSLDMLLRRSQVLLQRQNTVMDTTSRMGIALSQGNPTTVVGSVTVAQDFTTTSPEGSSNATVSWGKRSLRYPLAQGATCFENLFGDGQTPAARNADFVPSANQFGHIPRAGYDAELIKKNADQYPLAPGHVMMVCQGMGGPDHLTVYETAFPYAAYAPKGKVQLAGCWAWSNPATPYPADPPKPDTDYPNASGLPVLVRAQEQVQVTGDFPCGSAYSDEGPILLPKDCAGLAFTGPQPEDVYCTNLTAQVEDAFTRLSRDTQDKNRFIRGEGLTLDGFRKLITGGDWAQFLTVQQACSFPIPMFPVMQSDPPLVEILVIHHPIPPDFTGDAEVGQKDIDELKAINDEIKELQAKITEAQNVVNECQKKVDEISADPKRKDELPKAQADLQAAQLKLKGLKDELNEKTKRAQDIADDLKRQRDRMGGDGSTPGAIPDNAWQDETKSSGSGWAYINLIRNITRGIANAIKGEGSSALDDIASSVAAHTRLVHFGEMSPEWLFSDKGYTMKGTVNVPPGKTMKLGGGLASSNGDANVAIQGDLWIQRGATCYVDANLDISMPEEWEDFKDVAVDPVNPDASGLEPVKVPGEIDGAVNPFYPWGRVILEEGATLVVSGNLTVTGGSADTGSVLCCSKIGGNRPINTAILCKGDVELAHGVYSGVSLQDLIEHFCFDGNGSLRGFYQDFLNPFLGLVASNLCKVLGPFNERESYFAEFATTFVFMDFLAEFGLAEVPWPIPLPIKNRDCKIFEWMSTFYAYELNFTLGENFYTQCDWWLLGRGAAPAFLKVNPDGFDEAFQNVPYGKIVLDSLGEAFKDIIVDVIPDLVVTIVKEFIVKVVEEIIRDVVPWKIPGDIPETDKQNADKELKEKLKEELKKIIVGEIKKQAKEAVLKLAVKIKDAIIRDGSGQLQTTAGLREVSGVLLYSGGEMQIGQPGDPSGARTALGFYYAEEDLNVDAQKIVGCLISRKGSIRTSGDLLFYPYFTQANLYEPRKSAWEPFMLTPPKPDSDTSFDLTFPRARVTASGYLR